MLPPLYPSILTSFKPPIAAKYEIRRFFIRANDSLGNFLQARSFGRVEKPMRDDRVVGRHSRYFKHFPRRFRAHAASSSPDDYTLIYNACSLISVIVTRITSHLFQQTQVRLILPEHGIEFVEIPRRETGGRPISASRVRRLLDEGTSSQSPSSCRRAPWTTCKMPRRALAGLPSRARAALVKTISHSGPNRLQCTGKEPCRDGGGCDKDADSHGRRQDGPREAL
jgi:hypothetical protein